MSRQVELHKRAIERLTLQVEELRERAEILNRLTEILKDHPEATENDFDRYAKRVNAFGYGDYSPEPRAMPFDAVRHWLEVNTYGDEDNEIEF